MVTYENLYHLNLKPLESAAEAWQLRHKRLSEAAEDFDRDVVKAVDKAGWEESSQTEETAKSRLSHEHQELEQAGKVAKAVQDNLESAARRLKTKKRALVDLVETEIPKKFRVTDQGQVVPGDSFAADPKPGVTAPGYPRQEDAQEADQWQRRINKLLEEAATIDENAAARLRQNFQDDDDGSQFRNDAFAGGKADASADAGRAARLARKGDDMSLAEIKQLDGLMKEHGKDPAFASKFATSMGGKGTLDFWYGLRPGIISKDNPRHKAIEAMRGSLSRTLGTASGSGAPGMEQWKRDVIAAGDERQGKGDRNEPYGFQVMSDLMQEGEWDGEFLGDYGRELLTFEREAVEDGTSPKWLWQGPDAMANDPYPPERSWGNDPVTGLLKGVSNNPDAATDLFNDKSLFKDTSAYADQGLVNMPFIADEKESYSTAEYLLHHREYFDTEGNGKNPSLDALGDAMFAASSGRPPGDTTSPYLPPTPDQVAATNNSLHGLAENDKFPPELRDDAAKMVAHQGRNTYDSMALPRTMDAPLDRADLAKVTTEIAHDGAAYGTLEKHLNEVAINDIETENKYPGNSLDRAGRVNGFLEYTANSALSDDEEEKIDKGEWSASAAGSVASTGLGYIPVVGDALSGTSELVIEGAKTDHEDKVEETAEGKRQEVYEGRTGKMAALVEKWEDENGNWAAEQPSGYSTQELHSRISKEAANGREEAKFAEGK
ncbi:hypothetical protein GCM10012287_37240 [Streptomyces daqingensis]|uniref:AG2 protein n=1 Tax=Streptomyces daqingensis TaxID=1472640 RepID=A0ABQ2MJ54_9ACTN|nr:hypothetical protein [Streptomyces daqingensis]GGO52579.1 hypothetical protein GCM10012287_37240 [Streptomyces daqingensis]